MKIRFELSNIESEVIISNISSMTGDHLSIENFRKEETESYKWGSTTKGNGVVEIEFKSEFIFDCLDVVKPFVDMAKGLLPAVKGLLEQARTKMSRWDRDIRKLSPETAKVIWEENHGDIVVVANYKDWEWVDTAPNTRKKMEVCRHAPIIKKSELEKVLASDKDAKFYIFSQDGSFKEATIIEAVSKLW